MNIISGIGLIMAIVGIYWLLTEGAFGVVILIISASMLFGGAKIDAGYEWIEQESFNIYGVEDNFSTSGNIFYVNQYQKLYYFVDDGEGKRIENINVEKCVFVEDDDVIPHILVMGKYATKNKLFFTNDASETMYYVYIPIGSLKTEVNIDLK